MLASITPLGERGRHATWWITVTAFALGSTAAALIAGGLLGAAGSLLLPDSFGADGRLVVLAGVSALAIALDTLPARVPGPRRQVDERWLTSYRGWVYGLGFGAQLGLGVSTVVTSAATYLAVVAAFLSGGVGRGALVLGCFGAVRGLSLLAAAHVRSPRQLHALHRWIDRWRTPSARYGVALMGVIVVLAALGSAP